ncbi:MAG: hypothetical protein WC356_03065 [Candidatus Micrarchaeia archaeon]|jgi:hypothetical protein
MNKLCIFFTPNKNLVRKIIDNPTEVIDNLSKFLLVEEKLEIRKARLNKRIGLESRRCSIEKPNKKMEELLIEKKILMEAEERLYSRFPDRNKI